MIKVEIEISDNLATAFYQATSAYNVKHETTQTPKQRLKELARTFTMDTLHAARIEAANEAWAEESENLWK